MAGCSADGGMEPPLARLQYTRVADEEEALAILGECQGLFIGGRGRQGFGGEGSETQALRATSCSFNLRSGREGAVGGTPSVLKTT